MSTTEPIFAIRQVIADTVEKEDKMVTVFIDLEKAYDSIPRNQIWSALRRRKIPEYMVNLIENTYAKNKTTVKTSAGTTNSFEIKTGVHQGSALSPFLFNVVIDEAIGDILQETPVNMLYADDIVIIGKQVKEVEDRLQQIQERLENIGMKINMDKTEAMIIGGEETVMKERNGGIIKRVEQFKYLGSIITTDNNINADMDNRIRCGWQKFTACKEILLDKRVPVRLKGRILKTVVRPAILYGAEFWPVTQEMEKRVNIN